MMNDHDFEWDEAKAVVNLAKHGVTFESAKDVFSDAFAIELEGDREVYGEARYVTIGMAQGRLLAVTYTMRADKILIISARGAEPNERRRYHEDNA